MADPSLSPSAPERFVPERRARPRAPFRQNRRAHERVTILGQPMDLVKPEEVLHHIQQAVQQGEKSLIANHNLHSLYLMQKRPELGAFYDKADLILIGVSRSGKTPTSIYLSLQFGIRVANYPLTEEDLDDNRLPAVLRPHKNKLFGLMIDADRLVAIRTERKANSRYASFSQCQMELRAIEGIYISEGIKYLNVSEMSIEEISTRVLQMTGLKRRIG